METTVRRLIVGTLLVGLTAPLPGASAATPSITVTAPHTLSGQVRIAFSSSVRGVTTSNVVLRVVTPSSPVPTTIRCRRGNGDAVSCSAGPVRTVLLTPRSSLIAGQRYKLLVSPSGTPPVTTMTGEPVPATSRTFTAPGSVQEDSPAVTYRWTRRSSSSTYSGGFWVERTTGARADLRFSGTSVTWYTIVGPGFGKARMFIDGEPVRTVNNYAASTSYRVGRRISGLSAGSHRLTILALGQKGSTQATDARVAIDAFRIDTTLVRSPAIRFSWRIVNASGAHGGAYATSIMPGARATLAFKGKGIDWYTLRSPAGGKADVLLDGTRRRTVDLYASSIASKVRVSLAGLTDAVHTLSIVVRSDRNPASSNRTVAVDAFVVRRPSTAVFRGLGTWVDVFDYGLNPESAAASMAARGVRTLYLQTARWNRDDTFAYPDLVARWIHAAHTNRMRIVGWYLPAYDEWLDRDVVRTRAIASFRTSQGQRFDALGIDIEYKGQTESLTEFNEGIRLHLARVRSAVGNLYPIGAIVPAPRGMALSPSSWTGFPWTSIGRYGDVVMPMAYWSFRTDCPSNPQHCASQYTRNNITDARALTGLPVHVIGGVADDVTTAEVADFADATADADAIGGGLYDYRTTSSGYWSLLDDING